MHISLQFRHVKNVRLTFSSPNATFVNLPVEHQLVCTEVGGVAIFEVCPLKTNAKVTISCSTNGKI
jgi:hypothetical protein